ncbi:MAG: hypothetical protein Q4D71_01170 [Oscillospiraceae bacterium]|jgi:hypothetical protein|nr:hypothetical protein [Oscillospiraceae bacterium]MDO5137043.1 hypothetical protein [Oscillospiraceae bacterium]
MINPMDILKLKGMWQQFRDAHPKLVAFAKAVRNGYVKEGSVFDLTVTDPEGNSIRTNFRLSESDLELFRQLAELVRGSSSN